MLQGVSALKFSIGEHVILSGPGFRVEGNVALVMAEFVRIVTDSGRDSDVPKDIINQVSRPGKR